VLHPVGHLSLTVSAQLQAGPVSKNDLEGVGPIRGVGSPAATALLPPGPEEEGETGSSRQEWLEWEPLGLGRGLQTQGLPLVLIRLTDACQPHPFWVTPFISRTIKLLIDTHIAKGAN
jgi:hypothetical protein